MRNSALMLVALFGLAPVPASAQYPVKPIRWIVPLPPGGSNDIAARLIAEKLSRAFGQQVLVENRPGASGIIGTEIAARSAPDGYTVVSFSDTLTAAPHLYPKLSFDPVKDFTPVTQHLRQPVVLAAHPSLGVKSLAELIALAKAKPGIPYATSGAGSQQHIVAEWFASLAGIKLTHVPYKGGGQAISDFIAGQVPLASLGSSPLIPHYKAGKITLLAQSTRTRAPTLPTVPTYEEAGIEGLVLEQWIGVFVPAGTPNQIVARLNAAIVKALSDPKIRERFAEAALEPVGSTSEEFSKLVRANYESYGRLVRELKIKID